jgi:enoyl-CoA hydratase
MPVTLERRGAFAVLILDRQTELNALSFAILDQISMHLDEVADSDARALIVTGAGPKAFCAGADIKEMQRKTSLLYPTPRPRDKGRWGGGGWGGWK